VIRLLVAEDQALVRGAIVALLGLEHDLQVVAEVARGDEVVARALEARPDVAMLDIEMPGLDGLSAAAQLRTALPSCRVIVVTTFGRPGYLRRAMEAGASGFLLKDAPAPQLADAIRRVAAGGRVVDPALALDALSEGTNPLSMREREVLATSLEVATIAEMASRLSLSEGTVRNHLSAAIQKAGARNRAEAARIAEEKGWLAPDVDR
jgi:two-component system, NarL family, response regulator DesR